MSELPIPVALHQKLQRNSGIQQSGKRALLRLFPKEYGEHTPEWHNLEVLYEDDFVLVVLKPAGMSVHPAGPAHRGTLAHAVAAYYEYTGQSCKVRHIHRLDADTTGPVLYAKHEFSQLRLDEAMRKKQIGRTYIAAVHGQFQEGQGTIHLPIGRDRHHAGKRRVSSTGQQAATHFELLEQYPDASVMRLRLETGRTHQIRVHLSHLGHPIIGDRLYGSDSRLYPHQALHGERLEFEHPWHEDRVTVEASQPEQWHRLLLRLQQGF